MIKLYRYLTIYPEFHREKEFNAANRSRKVMMPHAPDPISEEGYFLTEADLKRVAQEAFEAARASYKELDIGYEEITYITFEHYWAEQRARKGEG